MPCKVNLSKKLSALWPWAPVTLGITSAKCGALNPSYFFIQPCWSECWGNCPFFQCASRSFYFFFRISSHFWVYQTNCLYFFLICTMHFFFFASFSQSRRILIGREGCGYLSLNRNLPFKIEIANNKDTKHQPPSIFPSHHPLKRLPTFWCIWERMGILLYIKTFLDNWSHQGK